MGSRKLPPEPTAEPNMKVIPREKGNLQFLIEVTFSYNVVLVTFANKGKPLSTMTRVETFL